MIFLLSIFFVENLIVVKAYIVLQDKKLFFEKYFLCFEIFWDKRFYFFLKNLKFSKYHHYVICFLSSIISRKGLKNTANRQISTSSFQKYILLLSLQPLRKKLRPREEEQVNEEDIRLNSRALQVFDSFCFETALQSRFCYLSVFCGLFTSNSILMPKNIEYNPIMVYSSTF